MGFSTFLVINNDNLAEIAEAKDFGGAFAAACRDAERRPFGFGDRHDPEAPKGVTVFGCLHRSTSAVAVMLGGAVALFDIVERGDGIADALARTLARMALRPVDRAKLVAALDGEAPPRVRATTDLDDLDSEHALAAILDPAKLVECHDLSSTGAFGPATLRFVVPFRHGAGLTVELDQTVRDSIGGGVRITPQVSVPHAWDDEVETRRIELTAWGIETFHELDLPALQALEPEERVHAFLKWLDARFCYLPATRTGTIDEMGARLEDAMCVFGMDGHADDLLIQCDVYAGGYHRAAAAVVTADGDRVRCPSPSWRLLRAIDLLLTHYAPWGGDLQLREGRVFQAVGRYRTSYRFGSLDTWDAEAPARLWEFCRVALKLSPERIRAMFDLPPDKDNFFGLRPPVSQ